MDLNPGYMSLLIVCILLILLASGWKESLFKGVSHRTLLIFLTGWTAIRFVPPLEVHRTLIVYGSFVYLLIFACAAIIAEASLLRMTQSFTAAFALGLLHFTLLFISKVDPALLHYLTTFKHALLLALTVSMLERGTVAQFMTVTLGLAMGDAALQMTKDELPYQLGTPAYIDLWWLVMFASRLFSIVLEPIYRGYRFALQSWPQRWKGGKRDE